MTAAEGQIFLGIDFGTSGARATLINDTASPVHEVKIDYEKQPSEEWDATWSRALDEVFVCLPEHLCGRIASVAFDGTSSTTLLIDEATGMSLEAPKWYNASQSQAAVEFAMAIAPEGHPGRASTSTLCKVIEWHLNNRPQEHQANGKHPVVMHQADWLSYLMHGDCRQSDYTNALKLGYDPEAEDYPPWLQDQIVAPGTPIGCITGSVQEKYRLKQDCLVCAGTTDSIAAFLASGAADIGEAVTSLGSTLAIKMLSTKRVDAVNYGVYSHRLGDKWLVGGASNTGGAVLKQYFSDAELRTLSERIDTNTSTDLNYYPLVTRGERFPFNDPNYEPRLDPRPSDNALFLQGILEGIASIEGRCYQLLESLGAGPVQKVWTAGGGAVNHKWTQIRRRTLGIPVQSAPHGEASYGAALLAKQGFEQH